MHLWGADLEQVSNLVAAKWQTVETAQVLSKCPVTRNNARAAEQGHVPHCCKLDTVIICKQAPVLALLLGHFLQEHVTVQQLSTVALKCVRCRIKGLHMHIAGNLYLLILST